MILYFREQYPLNLLREFGNPGHPPKTDFSCGLLLTTDAGQRTDWQGGGSLIPKNAFFVTNMRKIFIIYLWAVFSQGNSGSTSCHILESHHLLHSHLTNPLVNGGEKLTLLQAEI
jgi:hypothetical protein